MKIEDILKYLLNDNWDLVEKEHIYKILEKDECELLSNYIADLQRKEYNNSKANEYIKEHTNNFVEYLDVYETKELSNILEGDKDD